MLAAGFVAAEKAVTAEHDAVRHHFALGDCRAEPPGGAEQHVAVGGFAQTAARGARGNERLHQHRHRGVGRIEIVLRHIAARIAGPQRRPAGAQRGQELGVVVDAEKTLELAGKIGIGAILDQRRRTHRRGLWLVPPRSENLRQQVRREIALIKFQPDLDRQTALRRLIGVRVFAERFSEFEMLDLPPIGVGGNAEAARRRQSGMRQPGQVRRLRSHAIGIGGVAIFERDNETRHTKLVPPFRCALPLPACGERVG